MPVSSQGVTLERMIARRGPAWWDRMHDRGFRALVIDCDGLLAGYATLGRSRMPATGPSGEIYELYVRPEYHGCGLGRRLFGRCAPRTRAARAAAADGLGAGRERLACRFYRALGGVEAARCQDRFCGVPLDKIGFAWS